jgi:hypothetical protein
LLEVFLYSRALLRSDSQTPLQEEVGEVSVEEPPEPQGAACPHPLDEPALAPALRALPAWERSFKYHLSVAQALWSASQERYRTCQRLLSEQVGPLHAVCCVCVIMVWCSCVPLGGKVEFGTRGIVAGRNAWGHMGACDIGVLRSVSSNVESSVVVGVWCATYAYFSCLETREVLLGLGVVIVSSFSSAVSI